MASNINYASIDQDYPIAGKDNDSQGFRDNFGYIKNSLEAAKTEIDNLQNNSATTIDDNDFHNHQISKASLINCGEVLHDGGTVTATTALRYYEGSVQQFRVNANVTFTLSGFPLSGTAAKMRVYLTSLGGARTVTFQVEAGTIKKPSTTSNPITVSSQTDPVVIEFLTYDGGVSVFMNNLGTFV